MVPGPCEAASPISWTGRNTALERRVPVGRPAGSPSHSKPAPGRGPGPTGLRVRHVRPDGFARHPDGFARHPGGFARHPGGFARQVESSRAESGCQVWRVGRHLGRSDQAGFESAAALPNPSGDQRVPRAVRPRHDPASRPEADPGSALRPRPARQTHEGPRPRWNAARPPSRPIDRRPGTARVSTRRFRHPPQPSTLRVVAIDGDLTQVGARRQDVADSPGLRGVRRLGASTGDDRAGRFGHAPDRRPDPARRDAAASEVADGRRLPCCRTTHSRLPTPSPRLVVATGRDQLVPIMRAPPRRRDRRLRATTPDGRGRACSTSRHVQKPDGQGQPRP